MTRNRLSGPLSNLLSGQAPGRRSGRAALVAVAAALTLGLGACGSDESRNDSPAAGANATTTGNTGPQKPDDGSTQVKPDKKQPDSAGDRKKAPDDVISDRPGGPDQPDRP